MKFNRRKKQNDFEKIFDLDPEEKVKKKKVRENEPDSELTPEEAEKKRRKKSLKRKLLVIGLPAVTVIIVAVIVTVYLVNNTGYRLEIKNTFSVIFDDDATGLCENLSKINYRGYTYDEYLIKRYRAIDFYLTDFVDALKDTNGVENFKDENGKPEAYKIKVKKSEKLSADEINDLLSSSVGEGTEPSIKASEIEEVRKVNILLTVTGSKFITEYMVYDVYLVKENDLWKVYIDMNQLEIEQISQQLPADVSKKFAEQ